MFVPWVVAITSLRDVTFVLLRAVAAAAGTIASVLVGMLLIAGVAAEVSAGSEAGVST
jgi:hypothetical protein